ncbi:MAG: DUF4445 domain-containing protein [Nitrospirae bacterium]|nr:DUF4445 domain-containing protein [Nitrospirota bacterium]
MNHRSLAFSLDVKLSHPSSEDRLADAERLKDALKLFGLSSVAIPLNVLRRLSEELRKNDFSLTVVIGHDERGFRVIEISRSTVYGIALDIGTTMLECALFELDTRKRVAVSEGENPQIQFGTDVLSRAQMAMTGKAAELTTLLRDGVNSLVQDICSKNGVQKNDVYAMTVAGNTIMSHFFLGLDVRNIPVAPNTPAMSSAVFCTADEIGISIHPDATIYVLPNAGSYVGGDIISGMICTELLEQEDPVLFMDVGTNVEITLGCRHWIMVGAGAAGPALEGGVADIGKKAEKGTISRVEIDRDNKEPRLSVIGKGTPAGICGSGLIDLVSELYANGIIDQAGRFNRQEKGVMMKDGVPSYLLYRSPDRELLFTEHELQNFLRSKAALFAFLYVFLRLVGMRIADIGKIYISGALGCGINIESAVNIGMLPDIQRDKIVLLGNSSLKGASMILIDSSLVKEVEELQSLITYREMSEDTDLLNVLQGALFIPHTNPEMLRG